MNLSNKVQFYGTNWCFDCKRARSLLDRAKIEYDFIDIDSDKQAEEYVQSVNGGNRSVPTIVFPNGKILVEPSNQDLENEIRQLMLGR